MEKRYQVFVSSTFADLKEERNRVMQTLMKMDCIPAGMELFPAVDEEQWAFIRRVVDDCDYYLLIIGGRYGTTTPDGVSYTEKEYDYAVKNGIKVIALIHDRPDEIPAGKSEADPSLRTRLDAFREKAKKGRLVSFWNKPEELPGLVALSLISTIKTYPAVGWVRGNTIANEDLLIQLNDLRKENDSLRAALTNTSPEPIPRIEGLAGLDEQFAVKICFVFRDGFGAKKCAQTIKLSWKEIFALISPYIVKNPIDSTVKKALCNSLVNQINLHGEHHYLDDQCFQTIGIQLNALGLTKTENDKAPDGTMQRRWSLTPQGEQLMFQLRTVQSKV